jgi:catechol 2,3-dioxygenase-like lactoylglutathione lyase family enzyme
MALEVVTLPVSDVDRAKVFYEQLGFDCDVDHQTDGFRVVQFTPPGSGCSIAFGHGLGEVSQAPVVGLHLVVADLIAAVETVRAQGIDLGEVFHYGPEGPAPGIHPERADYASYAKLADPDGNVWLLQEVPSRGT